MTIEQEPAGDPLDRAMELGFAMAPSPAASSAELPERYELLGELGRGGVGVVLRARDRFLNREVAIKVLRDRHAEDVAMAQRFLEEAQVSAQLQHPGIVPVHEVGLLADGRPFFAMRLVGGESLAVRLQRRPGPATDHAELLEVFVRICETVAFAHARGIVHRDLKPGNVMLGAFGEVQVLDWGMAKVRQAGLPSGGERVTTVRTGSAESTSVAGSVLGTPGYLAPEQARGELDAIDARCDVFGLGAMLCEILTGKPACFGGDATVLRLQAARGDFHEAHGLLDRCGADPELVQLARDCIASDREDRPTSAAVIAGRLARHRDRQQQLARDAEFALGRAAADRRARRFAHLLLLALSILAAGGYWWQHDRQEARARADLAAVDALANLEPLQRQAEHSGDPADWRTALAAAKQASAAVDAHPPATALAQRTRDALAEVAQHTRVAEATAHQAERDRTTLTRLDELRSQFAQHLDRRRLAADYEAAFADYGLTLEQPFAEVAATLRRSAIAAELVVHLDDYDGVRNRIHDDNDPDSVRWRALADEVDHDRVRRAVRAAYAGDEESLVQIADGLDVGRVSVGAALALSRKLEYAGRRERALQLLLDVQVHHADDFWLNWTLANFHGFAKPPEHAAAIEWLRICCALRPDSRMAWENLGADLAQAGQLERAEAPMRRAIELDDSQASSHYNLGTLCRLTGRKEAAIEHYRAAVARAPTNAEYVVKLAFLLLQDRRFAEAEQVFVEALTRQPDSTALLMSLGAMCCDQLGDLDRAELLFRHIIDLDPTRIGALWNLARVAGLRGQTAAKRTFFECMLLVEPSDPGARVALARLAATAGDWPTCREHAQVVVARDPRLHDGWSLLGLACSELGDSDAAVAALAKATEVKPDSFEDWFNLGRQLWRRKELEAAAAAFTTATTLRDDGDAWRNLGQVKLLLHDPVAGMAHLRRAIRVDPERVDFLEELARAAYRIGDLSTLTETWGQVAARQPTPVHKSRYASTLIDAHRFAEALHELRAEPVDASVHAQLMRGMALLETGQWQEAVADLQAAGTDRGKPTLHDQLRRECEAMEELSAKYTEPWTAEPMPTATENIALARLCLLADHPAEATARCQRALQQQPDLPFYHHVLAARVAVAAAASDPRAAKDHLDLARQWLTASAAWVESQVGNDDSLRSYVHTLLLDPGLAAIRRGGAMAEGWDGFWARVQAIVR